MSKRLANEKEIEKNRIGRKWDKVISLVSALNVKNAGGALSSEEVELFCCFYLGEAELEIKIEEAYTKFGNVLNIKLPTDDLKQAYSYLSAALTAVKKSKDKYPHLLQDTTLLFAKYHFIIGDYSECLSCIQSVEDSGGDGMSKRSKLILSEALTCKAISLESTTEDSGLNKDIIMTYEKAGEIALSICIEDEKQGTIKRSASTSHYSIRNLSRMTEMCLLRPGHLLLENGLVEDAIHNYRSLLRLIETKVTVGVRKIVCRCLAQVLLSCTCPQLYTPPSTISSDSIPRTGSVSIAMSTPRKDSPEFFGNSSLKKTPYPVNENLFCPRDEVEESLLLLLIAESMHLQRNEVKQTLSESSKKQKILNETNIIYDLLVFVLSRRDQYLFLSNCFERTMKLAYEEFTLWYHFGLSLVCAGKYSRALLMFEQCHKLQPDNSNVLMFCAKLCINYLQEYSDGITYATRVLDITSDPYIEAGARCAMGICYNQMSVKGKTFKESQCLLKTAAQCLERARELDGNDPEILFNLSWTYAMSKQVSKAFSILKESLAYNPTDLNSMHLLVLLLSAQKKHKEALEVLESAIEEYPTEFPLLLTKVKLIEECHGSQAALVVCHGLLKLWNNLYNEMDYQIEYEDGPPELPKSPSFSISKSLNESKLMDATASLKRVTLADSTSVDDDGTGSIAASVRIEKALSEAASGTITSSKMGVPRSIALLAKLWLVTAECFINVEDATEAGGCILEASSFFPLSPDVLYMRGRLNELQLNMEEAQACYESSLSVFPNHKAARQRLGLIYHDRGDWVLAEKMIRDCLLYDASNHTVWNDLGLVLESCGRYEEAAECFLTSLRLENAAPIISYTSIPRAFKAYDT